MSFFHKKYNYKELFKNLGFVRTNVDMLKQDTSENIKVNIWKYVLIVGAIIIVILSIVIGKPLH